MNRDDIIRMAREAGGGLESDYTNISALKRFAALVAAAERDHCAQIADAEASIEGIAQRISAAIRARGETKWPTLT